MHHRHGGGAAPARDRASGRCSWTERGRGGIGEEPPRTNLHQVEAAAGGGARRRGRVRHGPGSWALGSRVKTKPCPGTTPSRRSVSGSACTGRSPDREGGGGGGERAPDRPRRPGMCWTPVTRSTGWSCRDGDHRRGQPARSSRPQATGGRPEARCWPRSRAVHGSGRAAAGHVTLRAGRTAVTWQNRFAAPSAPSAARPRVLRGRPQRDQPCGDRATHNEKYPFRHRVAPDATEHLGHDRPWRNTATRADRRVKPEGVTTTADGSVENHSRPALRLRRPRSDARDADE